MLTTRFLTRITPQITNLRLLATGANVGVKNPIFRSIENEPSKHNSEHLGQYYTIPSTDKSLFLYGGLPTSFITQAKTFTETALMIRKPALEIINCLKNINYDDPAVRFVLFGKQGSGRSLTLAHVLHYAFKEGFLLVHIPWVGNWMRRCKESSASETKPGLIDINIDAAAWLLHFKTQNEQLLQNAELKTSQDFVWSKRETTPQGSPLLEMIDFGISRIKYASECVNNLASEIKLLTMAKQVKTLVAIDGFNAFFYPETNIKTEKKEIVHPKNITVTDAFLKLTRYDWNNCAIVVTVDEIAISPKDYKSHLPRYLLGKDGFEHLDPFYPVFVPEYSEKELKSCMTYYRERRWVHTTPEQDAELAFLSASNPYKLMQITASL